ncbi:hypothetical protein BDN71DRAFT_1435926 [Pleurotus eryngii]|uniref:Uncharacterized protein n=1 Tax=Pleurotus eryngii TaxID=5323 RepID=A0A9P5ZJU8_PLEER|nr:hypothetical protein BDN71DRAFT_1435926 [Pleurotus eryngii]
MFKKVANTMGWKSKSHSFQYFTTDLIMVQDATLRSSWYAYASEMAEKIPDVQGWMGREVLMNDAFLVMKIEIFWDAEKTVEGKYKVESVLLENKDKEIVLKAHLKLLNAQLASGADTDKSTASSSIQPTLCVLNANIILLVAKVG